MTLPAGLLSSQPEEPHVAQTLATANINLGFLTILQESSGFLGGYLVTNQWGRPLEFRLSTAVQPNRIHQILYGQTLQGYLAGELIGKTLVEKSAAQAQFIITDHADALHLRPHVSTPVLLSRSAPEDSIERDPLVCVRPSENKKPAIYGHAGYPEDRAAVLDLLERYEGGMDLAEPFARIREAIGEARKMGVTARG